MEDVKNIQKHFFEYVENSIINNKKVSHAYLIETKGYKNYQHVIIELIKIILTIDKKEEEKERIYGLIDSNNYPDLKYIYPDGVYVKKEQLLQLENQYMKKSMLDNKLIYVIDPADKLNQSSANTILKFLEEPPEDVVAILITENKYNVLETIVSRCQILSLLNNEKKEYDETVMEFVSDLNNPKNILIKYDYYLDKLFSDRDQAIINLKTIEEYLFEELKVRINEKSIEKFINYIELIENEKEKLGYNINMKLWFSNYIFNVMEVNKDA